MASRLTAGSRDADEYLGFVAGLRAFTQKAIRPVMERAGQAALARGEDLDSVPAVAMHSRLMRSTQEMKWTELVPSYHAREAPLLRALDAADRSGPGSVRWDPNFAYPEYFTKGRFHLQPGGYFTDPLAGYLYHHGTEVFFTGRNDNDELHRGLIDLVPQPAGRLDRILDLGCSAGQSTIALKRRFPQAEVWGIDIAAPMVRYAHRRAVDLAVDVHFVQMPAEALRFADGSMDIVHAFILFHEIPAEIARRVVGEAYRVLRPGGVFVIADFANRPQGLPALAAHQRAFDTNDNGERYASEFVFTDFGGVLRSAGFSRVDENAAPGHWIPVRVCVK